MGLRHLKSVKEELMYFVCSIGMAITGGLFVNESYRFIIPATRDITAILGLVLIIGGCFCAIYVALPVIHALRINRSRRVG